ncbi:hypothetical protein Nepgr_032960 [Nepenthes gracilis]|uniref:Uncharacterized protein n=1 Tax=Nepenthes gracilis TaxID=150966 RepID=A0AAD3TKH8_NEPGR|nr:hypothetical protein Nepgr_032960 [Nepenthes gracilis]
MADPHVSHQRPPPFQPQGSWYSGQFQYHPSHSPSPLPPPPQPWSSLPPPPHSDHLPPPPSFAPYIAHPHHAQYLPPPPALSRPQMPPPPRPHSQQPYPQEWGNTNWAYQSGWDYPAHGNEEDWAAKARAWAAAKASIENQHPQSQFASLGQLKEHSHIPNQYPQAASSYYQDIQQTSVPMPSYQNHPVQVAPLNKPRLAHQQEFTSMSSAEASYAPDVHFSYGAKDGNLSVEVGDAFPTQERLTSPSVPQQEVSLTYSSVPGKEYPLEGQHHDQSPVSAIGRSILTEQTQFAYPLSNPCDQPLEFAPRFNNDYDSQMKSSHHDSAGSVRGADSISPLPSLYPWTPLGAPIVPYPSVPPTFPSTLQHDPSLGASPLPGQPSSMFGRVPGPSFPPEVSSAATPVGLAAGTALHPTTFPGDEYVSPMGSERHRKAAVPNWLKEEIIKNKAAIASSAPDHVKEETQNIKDEVIAKSVGKADLADRKSIDSSRSTEDEDDDEDYIEAAKTTAINQEIKCILTEVLLKVTDKLFDEIATKVLSEDDPTVDADHGTVGCSTLSLPPLAFPDPKASANILIPVKPKESKADNVSEKSSSGAPGNVLGLASYASDDDADEIQSSNKPTNNNSTVYISPNSNEFPEYVHDAVANGLPRVKTEDPKFNSSVCMEEDHNSIHSTRVNKNHSAQAVNMGDNGLGKNLDYGDTGPAYSSGTASLGRKDGACSESGKFVDLSDASKTKDNVGKLAAIKPEVPCESDIIRKSMKENSQERESGRHNRHESKRSSSMRDSAKDKGSSKVREEGKAEDSHGRRDERQQRKDKMDDCRGPKERSKEQVRHGEKTKEADSRKISLPCEFKEGRKERERVKKGNDKDDADRKRVRTKDEKADRSRHGIVSDAGKHKTKRFSSDGSRDRNSKDKSVSYSDNSSDDASEGYRRKRHSEKHNLSPSPDWSRRRQVLRSPHSKRTQRRHSPYTSFETSRGRRSRSRSPLMSDGLYEKTPSFLISDDSAIDKATSKDLVQLEFGSHS